MSGSTVALQWVYSGSTVMNKRRNNEGITKNERRNNKYKMNVRRMEGVNVLCI